MRTIDQIQGAAADHFGNGDVNQAMGEVTDLIHAVIADELPSIAKAVLNHPIDKLGDPIEYDTFAEALAPQPEAAGDVPEFGLAMQQHKGVIRNALAKLLNQNDEWHRAKACDALDEICQQGSELSRRVAEVAADRDKWIERAGEHAKTIGEQAKQLATSQPEVERLRDMSNFEERANAWSLVWKTCNEVGMDSFKCNEYSGQGMVVAFIKHLAAEVSRLSRPVDKESIYARWADIGKFISTVNEFASAVEPLLKAERNARESAEAERDELREFVKMKAVSSYTPGYSVTHFSVDDRYAIIPDAELDKMLAAYRAEKAKVQP